MIMREIKGDSILSTRNGYGAQGLRNAVRNKTPGNPSRPKETKPRTAGSEKHHLKEDSTHTAGTAGLLHLLSSERKQFAVQLLGKKVTPEPHSYSPRVNNEQSKQKASIKIAAISSGLSAFPSVVVTKLTINSKDR